MELTPELIGKALASRHTYFPPVAQCGPAEFDAFLRTAPKADRIDGRKRRFRKRGTNDRRVLLEITDGVRTGRYHATKGWRVQRTA